MTLPNADDHPLFPGRQFPVWRVAISQAHNDPSDPSLQSPLRRTSTKPETTSFQPYSSEQPDSMSLLPPRLRPAPPDILEAERYIWFAPVDPKTAKTPAEEQQKIFWNRSGNAEVPPASYLVVGPRLETRKGSKTGPEEPPTYDPSNHRIALLGNSIETYSSNDLPKTPSANFAKPARTIEAAANSPQEIYVPDPTRPDELALRPSAWDPSWRIGLNISEPIPLYNAADPDQSYYDVPTHPLSVVGGFTLVDSYYDYDQDPPSADRLPTRPFDFEDWAPLFQDGIVVGEPDNPEFEPKIEPDYKTAFLQRLANPLEPWDPYGNPYITVDWIPIDLVVFNGEGDNTGTPSFVTRERGDTDTDLKFWKLDTQSHPAAGPANASDYFQVDLGQSLGYLNDVLRIAAGGALVNPSVAGPPFLGQPTYPAPTYRPLPPDSPNYIGDPARPFPWLTWHNRPFANPMELMQVPASSQGRLLHEFDIAQAVDPYDSAGDDPLNFAGTFPHLLNFFHSSKLDPANQRGANFYRLFDYVETPSPFVGAEKWYNPQTLVTDNYEFHYHPPYNHFSRFQDPGTREYQHDL